MNPKLIKLTSGDAVYANQDLVKFIKQSISVDSGEVKPDDNIYFFKDVEFKRDRLSVSKENYQRVIKLEKANVVIVNRNITLPHNAVSLLNNKIDSNCPANEADDVLFNVSNRGSDYLDTIKQWYQLSQLVNKPRIVFEDDILKYINSGMVIDDTNFTFVLDILNSDFKMGANIIDTCDIEKSFDYIIAILYFKGHFMTLNRLIYDACPNVRKYFATHNIGNNIPEKYVYQMMQNQYLKDRITTKLLTEAENKINGLFGQAIEYIDSINIDFLWKKS